MQRIVRKQGAVQQKQAITKDDRKLATEIILKNQGKIPAGELEQLQAIETSKSGAKFTKNMAGAFNNYIVESIEESKDIDISAILKPDENVADMTVTSAILKPDENVADVTVTSAVVKQSEKQIEELPQEDPLKKKIATKNEKVNQIIQMLPAQGASQFMGQLQNYLSGKLNDKEKQKFIRLYDKYSRTLGTKEYKKRLERHQLEGQYLQKLRDQLVMKKKK